MKHKILWVIFFCLISSHTIAAPTEKPNSIKIENRLYDLEHKVKIIDSNQLNYKIEKDLLKETYSNNYEKINTFITFALGLFAILGYLGIRDIGAIKEKYGEELSKIKELKNQFYLKSSEFDNDKKKIDDEIKTIFRENQEQNQKIKFIELKEKMDSLFKDRNLGLALDFANAALEINNADATCLNTKGSILTQLNQLPDALTAFAKALENNPNDSSTKINYAECLYFSGKIDKAKELINQNKTIFEEKNDGELLNFFKLIELYFESDLEQLKEIAKGYVQYDNMGMQNKKLKGWNFTDAQMFAHYMDDGDLKTAIQSIIWYWNAELNGKQLLINLGIPLPSPPNGE